MKLGEVTFLRDQNQEQLKLRKQMTVYVLDITSCMYRENVAYRNSCKIRAQNSLQLELKMTQLEI